ncbi:MAG: hypothetical protein M1375_01860 [Candidatus Thermoplasmatota archaeon]|jgi:alpha-amylase/alpha-mannosidase (GH57 family)|nr:hypothetical protein [Candidatus Thermoplasmatota archaeon]MCL5790703.1 hypothetical protein [Candidatus Thermoplasmatota archaeon]
MNKHSSFAVFLVCALFILTAFSVSTSMASTGEIENIYNIPAVGNMTFNGSLSQNFNNIQPLYVNDHTSPWGAGNNISDMYASYNATCLFLGFRATFTGNSLIVFINNGTSTDLGTYNFSTMNVWTRDITFTIPVNYFFADYAGQPSQSYSIRSQASSSNRSSYGVSEPVVTYFTSNSVEIGMPLTAIFGNSYGNLDFHVSAFIIGGSGSWVGTGIPFEQAGHYNSGNVYNYFLINNTLNLEINREKPLPPPPINLDFVYNDHQPLYSPVSYSYWLLPWADVHLEEYAEQALIMSKYTNVNVTYSLSGSLLLQIDAIRDGNYNNSYIKAALIPEDQWNNTVYYEMSHFGDTFLKTFVGRDSYNNTSVRQVLQDDLAFNSPSWVYSSGTPAGNEYSNLLKLQDSGKVLSNRELQDAVVEFFLWSVSYPIISGQIGEKYLNSSLLSLYNQTSFSVSQIGKIISYYPFEANLVISTFLKDHENGNVELMTTPFDHPILPLLLQDNWTDQNGANITKGIWGNDVNAQLNVGRDIFYSNFGYYPSGQWTPEQAVSNQIVPFLAGNGVKWTSTDQAVLSESGKLNATPGTASYYEQLYKPYKIETPNGTETFVFRDSTLSNNWAFNYGNLAASSGSQAPVNEFMSYLKNIYNTVPANDHKNTLVTVAIDGENWMFESPFPEDAVPFLQDLYSSLSSNSSWVRTVNMGHYIHENRTEGNLSYLPTGSWNYQGYAGSVSPYLTQWAGHPSQDEAWQQLAITRNLVVDFGAKHNLTEPINLSQFMNAFNYPFIGSWRTATLQEKYDEAWFSILAAEGSDIYFSFDPGDQDLYAKNDIVFEHEVRVDMRNALNVLGIPETPYLAGNWEPPLKVQATGGQRLISPQLDGSLYNETSVYGINGFSVNHNNPWNGSYLYKSGSSGGISIRYGYNSSDLFIAVRSSRFPFNRGIDFSSIQFYFSPAVTGTGNLVGLSYPGAQFGTVEGQILHFPGEYLATIGPYNGSTGMFNLNVYHSINGTIWRSSGNSGYAVRGQYDEFEISLSSIGFTSGNNYVFSMAHEKGRKYSVDGPLPIHVNIPEQGFHLISSLHNTARGNGPGNYTYPLLSADYPGGSVTIKWFNISESQDGVMFSLRFGNLSNVFDGPYGFTQPVVDIYIHQPSFPGGATNTQPGVNAVISGSGAWEYMIQVAGFPGNAYIINSTNVNFGNDLTISANLSDSTVYVTVPYMITGTNPLVDGYTVVSDFQNGYEPNGWNPVGVKASSYQGGGSGGANAPNIYSYLAPAILNESPGLTQQEVLSSYNSTHLATLYPVFLKPLNYTQSTSALKLPSHNAFLTYGGSVHAFYIQGTNLYESTSISGVQWGNPLFISTESPGVIDMNGAFEGSIPAISIATSSTISIYFPENGTYENISAGNHDIASSFTVGTGSSLIPLILNSSGIYYLHSGSWRFLFNPDTVSQISATYERGMMNIFYESGGQIMETSILMGSRYNSSPVTVQTYAVSGNIHGKITSLDSVNLGWRYSEISYTILNSTGSRGFVSIASPFISITVNLGQTNIRFLSIGMDKYNTGSGSMGFVGGPGDLNLYYFPVFF